jgi:hypothetical protein
MGAFLANAGPARLLSAKLRHFDDIAAGTVRLHPSSWWISEAINL